MLKQLITTIYTLNLKSIDVMLEHKIITTDYVIKLVDANKIKVTGIDNIINKYNIIIILLYGPLRL